MLLGNYDYFSNSDDTSNVVNPNVAIVEIRAGAGRRGRYIWQMKCIKYLKFAAFKILKLNKLILTKVELETLNMCFLN